MDINIKIQFSALWAAMMFLYVYADLLTLYKPGQLSEIMQGRMGPFEASQTSLLLASILVSIPALMIFLSLVMKPQLNRWANIVLGLLYTLVNISNLIGESWAYYIMFGILEIGITLLIIAYAWRWQITRENEQLKIT